MRRLAANERTHRDESRIPTIRYLAFSHRAGVNYDSCSLKVKSSATFRFPRSTILHNNEVQLRHWTEHKTTRPCRRYDKCEQRVCKKFENPTNSYAMVILLPCIWTHNSLQACRFTSLHCSSTVGYTSNMAAVTSIVRMASLSPHVGLPANQTPKLKPRFLQFGYGYNVDL